MKRFEQPQLDWRVVFLIAFVLALLLIVVRTWQLAYLAGFVAGMLSVRLRRGVVLGAAGVGFAWIGYLAFVFASAPAQELASLTVQILGMDGGSWWLLPLLSVVLGILVGAVGGFTGHVGAQLFLWSKPSATIPAKD